MPRFVILRHEVPPGRNRPSHWDLMLEAEGVLQTWALASEPGYDVGIWGQALPDHRLAYLDYEGPVSGDRGTVARWDAGSFAWLQREPDVLAFLLDGERLRGHASLQRQSATRWRLCIRHPPADQRRGSSRS